MKKKRKKKGKGEQEGEIFIPEVSHASVSESGAASLVIGRSGVNDSSLADALPNRTSVL